MPFKPLHKKIAYWIGGILFFLVVVVGAAAVYLNAKWKPLVTKKIKEGVYNASAHLYRIDFKDIHINLVTGNAVLDSITIMPDTAVFNQLKLQRKAPTHLFRIKLAHLKLSRVALLNVYFNKKLRLNTIVLDHPSIDMIYHKVPKRTITIADSLNLFQQISKTIRSVRINAIRIVDADFDYYNGAKKLQSVKRLTIDFKDILIDSAAQNDSTRILFAKNIGFNLSGYQSVTKDKMYTVKLDTLEGSLTNRTLAIKGLKMIPRYPDLTFSRKYAIQKDRYDLDFREINLTGVDFLALNNDGNLHAKKVVVGPAKVAIFMNRQLPPPNFDKGRNYPHLALKRLAIPTIIDTLRLNRVDLAYTEFSEQTKERGTVRLANITGNILNLTNDSMKLTKRNHAVANLTTQIMGVGEMNVKIDFNLTDKNAAFSYEGNIGPFDMRVLNPLAKPLGQIQIESGKVTKAYFKVSADFKRSNGIVAFEYRDLKVNLLGEKDENGNKGKKILLSFLANKILIKDANPTEGDDVRIAKVAYQRLPQASFFNVMWKTVFVGIRENVGIGFVPMKKTAAPKESRKKRYKKASRT